MGRIAISTIIPTHNRAHLIGRAVSSALAQQITGDEVIVVDDGSSDDSEAALAQYRDRIRYVRILHSGAGVARNRGIKEARKELVAFLDSDDEWMPGKLELQRSLFEALPEILFCFSDFAVRSIDGREHRNYLARWHNDPRSWDEILGPGLLFSSIASPPAGLSDFKFHVGNLYLLELTGSYICTDTLVVRRQEAGEALHFGEGLPTCEDKECIARLASKGSGAYLDCETACQISHDGPRLTALSPAVSAEARITIMKRVWGSDPEFMKEHGTLYRRTLNEQRLIKIRDLISQGRASEARAELGLVKSAPLHYKILSHLPGGLLPRLADLRRRVLRLC